MQGVLKDIFYVEFRADKQRLERKPGHQKAIARYCEEEKRLRKLLNTEQIKLLEHFQDNNSLLEQMEIEHSFRFGYRIGAQMTAELQKAMDSPIE